MHTLSKERSSILSRWFGVCSLDLSSITSGTYSSINSASILSIEFIEEDFLTLTSESCTKIC
jgi:hypothetical protein